MFPAALGMINRTITSSNSSLFQVRSVKELLWGYRDPFLEKLLGGILPDKTTGVFYPVSIKLVYHKTSKMMIKLYKGLNASVIFITYLFVVPQTNDSMFI